LCAQFNIHPKVFEMSFVEPNFGQSQQNKKIVQELEEKKRRMRSATGNFHFLFYFTSFLNKNRFCLSSDIRFSWIFYASI
jgi:hypothetical protein